MVLAAPWLRNVQRWLAPFDGRLGPGTYLCTSLGTRRLLPRVGARQRTRAAMRCKLISRATRSRRWTQSGRPTIVQTPHGYSCSSGGLAVCCVVRTMELGWWVILVLVLQLTHTVGRSPSLQLTSTLPSSSNRRKSACQLGRHSEAKGPFRRVPVQCATTYLDFRLRLQMMRTHSKFRTLSHLRSLPTSSSRPIIAIMQTQRLSENDGDERPGTGHIPELTPPSPSQSQALGGAHTFSPSSAFNTSAAINRLPIELIVEILSSGAWAEWHELLLLTHVCRRWRAVARGIVWLWADAVASAFKARQDHIRCLPTLLQWSVPYPLRLEIRSVPRLGRSAVLEPHFDILGPHFSRISHLSVDIACTANVVAVLDAARSGMRRLESLRIMQILGALVSVDDRVALDDSDLPLLNTLFFPGFFFTRSIAVKSLKSITIEKDPRSRDIFLAALDRCALGLESLTLDKWTRIDWMGDETVSTFPSVELPSLRHLNVTVPSYADPPVLFLPGLLLPPDVRMHISWHQVHDRNTRALLPRNLIGLHAPPFFDSLCVHMSGINSVAFTCFAGGVERLCVEQYSCDREKLPSILDEYTSPNVSALSLYFTFDNEYKSFVNTNYLSAFLDGFPNLRRLDLLGRAIRDVKLQLAEAFVQLAAYSRSHEPEFCLGLALEVEEPPPDPSLRVPDPHYYSAEHQGALVCGQLDDLEDLLYLYYGAGAPKLHRLELVVTVVRLVPENLLRAQYCSVADAPASAYWARWLAGVYVPRFQEVVEEVVFLGDTGTGGAEPVFEDAC